MFSPLEERPKILEKIGLFIVLFNIIDFRLGYEFYSIIDQSDKKKRAILTFLETRDFSAKLSMLEQILGKDLYSKIKGINEVRNTLTHGMYGENKSSGDISATKRTKQTGEYVSIEKLTEKKLNSYIKEEREILASLHELIIKRNART